MASVKNYYRPTSVAEALDLLARPGTTALAGGTRLVPRPEEWEAVVDLQAAGLDGVEIEEERAVLGAMTRIQALVDHEDLPEALRRAAHREGPNTFRSMGTVGGAAAAADPESELFAALLVFEAVVTLRSAAGGRETPLAGFRPAPGELITAVTIQTGGTAAAERVARTPADSPIVAVLGRRDPAGRLHLAFCGMGERPLLAAPEAIDRLDPPGDFRGSSGYRRQMAIVLSRRVLDALEESAP